MLPREVETSARMVKQPGKGEVDGSEIVKRHDSEENAIFESRRGMTSSSVLRQAIDERTSICSCVSLLVSYLETPELATIS